MSILSYDCVRAISQEIVARGTHEQTKQFVESTEVFEHLSIGLMAGMRHAGLIDILNSGFTLLKSKAELIGFDELIGNHFGSPWYCALKGTYRA